MTIEELPYFCVRIRGYINDKLAGQGSGTLIVDNNHYYVMTASHTLCDKEKKRFEMNSLKLDLVLGKEQTYILTVISVVEFSDADDIDWALLEIEKPEVDFDYRRIKRCNNYKYNNKEIYGFYGFTQLEDLGALYRVELRGQPGAYWHISDIPIDGQADDAHKLIDGNSGAGVFFEHAGIYYIVGYVKCLINSNGAYSDFILYNIPTDSKHLSTDSVKNIDLNVLAEWQKEADVKIKESVLEQYQEKKPDYLANLERKLAVIYSDDEERQNKMDTLENDYIEGSAHMLKMVRDGNSLYEELNKEDEELTARINENRRIKYVDEDKAEDNLKEVREQYKVYARNKFTKDTPTETLTNKYAAYRVAEKLMNCTIDYKKK